MNVEGVDSVVRSVLEKFVARSRFGREKYGTDLDRTDLAVGDWITHTQEELMDGILYLEKLRGGLSLMNPTISPNDGGLGGASGKAERPKCEASPPTKIEDDDVIHTYTT